MLNDMCADQRNSQIVELELESVGSACIRRATVPSSSLVCAYTLTCKFAAVQAVPELKMMSPVTLLSVTCHCEL
jgi:hypothetical protein